MVSTLGEVVYLGTLGPKGGGEASASGEQQDTALAASSIPTAAQPLASPEESDSPLVEALRAFEH